MLRDCFQNTHEPRKSQPSQWQTQNWPQIDSSFAKQMNDLERSFPCHAPLEMGEQLLFRFYAVLPYCLDFLLDRSVIHIHLIHIVSSRCVSFIFQLNCDTKISIDVLITMSIRTKTKYCKIIHVTARPRLLPIKCSTYHQLFWQTTFPKHTF